MNTIAPPDQTVHAAAHALSDAQAKPVGALGRLEELAAWVAACQGECPPRPLTDVRVVVFAGDHGVAASGVSAYPAEVTPAMVHGILAGGAGVNALARAVGASVTVYDFGVRVLEGVPEGLSLGEECELKDAMEGGAVVKCQNQELQSDEIAKHLEAGKQVTKLALVLDDHVSFVLGEDLIVRKLKFLDGAVDQLENTEHDDLRAELDARFALMAGELKRLFLVLEYALKLSKAD